MRNPIGFKSIKNSDKVGVVDVERRKREREKMGDGLQKIRKKASARGEKAKKGDDTRGEDGMR